MNSPTLPAPAMATRISGAPLRARGAPAARRAPTRRRRSAGRRRPGRSRSGVLTCAAPSRVMATSQNTPGSLSGASFLPAHFAGIG